jgi:hypothetical protein
MTRAWGGQWNAEHELRRAHNDAKHIREMQEIARRKGLRTTILSDWHPWFAWYPVKPIFIAGPNKYPEVTGMKMTESGWPIWLRRCWRRRTSSRVSDWKYGGWEYRRWVKHK